MLFVFTFFLVGGCVFAFPFWVFPLVRWMCYAFPFRVPPFVFKIYVAFSVFEFGGRYFACSFWVPPCVFTIHVIFSFCFRIRWTLSYIFYVLICSFSNLVGVVLHSHFESSHVCSKFMLSCLLIYEFDGRCVACSLWCFCSCSNVLDVVLQFHFEFSHVCSRCMLSFLLIFEFGGRFQFASYLTYTEKGGLDFVKS